MPVPKVRQRSSSKQVCLWLLVTASTATTTRARSSRRVRTSFDTRRDELIAEQARIGVVSSWELAEQNPREVFMSQFPPDSSAQPTTPEPAVEPPFGAPKPPTGGVPLWATLVSSLVCLGVGLSVSLLVASRKSEPPPHYVAPQASSAEAKKPAPTELELAAQGDPRAVYAL